MTTEASSKYHDGLFRPLLDAPSVRFDSSVGRGDFKTKIGVGKVIRGTELAPCTSAAYEVS